jgi:hypothetical protein
MINNNFNKYNNVNLFLLVLFGLFINGKFQILLHNYFKEYFYICLYLKVYASCYLPNTWYGKWYQGKDIELTNINRTHFLNRGTCIEQRQDKFIFYDG